jgi:hypothetical protein
MFPAWLFGGDRFDDTALEDRVSELVAGVQASVLRPPFTSNKPIY